MLSNREYPVGWTVAPFAEVIDFQEGPGIMARDFCPAGVPLIRLAGLEPGVPILTGCNYLDPEMVARRWPHFRLTRSDVLLSTSASLGRTAIVDGTAEGAVAYTGLIRMRPRDSRIKAGFIRYALESPHFKVQIEAAGVGSVLRHFGPSHLRRMSLVVPPRPAQEAIASILGALDDKIELNRRTNQTLEAIARAIFKSWFVDFDPVRAKMDDRQPFGMDAGTAAILPAALQPSDTGYVPAGWMIERIGDVATINERSVSRSAEHDVIDYVDISSVAEGHLLGTTPCPWTLAPGRARRVVRHGDTIWSTVRPNRRSYWFVQRPSKNMVVSTGFAVLSPSLVPPTYLYAWVTTPQFVEYLTQNADGSAYPAVPASRFEDAPILRPPSEVLAAFEMAVGPLREASAANDAESRTLAALRDALVPRLLSGEIRLRDAERAVSEAV